MWEEIFLCLKSKEVEVWVKDSFDNHRDGKSDLSRFLFRFPRSKCSKCSIKSRRRFGRRCERCRPQSLPRSHPVLLKQTRDKIFFRGVQVQAHSELHQSSFERTGTCFLHISYDPSTRVQMWKYRNVKPLSTNSLMHTDWKSGGGGRAWQAFPKKLWNMGKWSIMYTIAIGYAIFCVLLYFYWQVFSWFSFL